jgi:hypothetical protein
LDREDVAGVAKRYPVLADRLEDVATKWLDGEGFADSDRPTKVEPVQTPVEKLETQIAKLAKQQTDMQKDIGDMRKEMGEGFAKIDQLMAFLSPSNGGQDPVLHALLSALTCLSLCVLSLH